MIFTDGNAIYIQYALQGKTDTSFDFNRQKYLERIHNYLNNWKNIKAELVEHANKIRQEFNPYASSLSILSDYLNRVDHEWLQNIAEEEYFFKSNIAGWIKDVRDAIDKVDESIDKIKKGFTDVSNIRTAVDELMDKYSGRGYFNYDQGN